MSLYHPSRNRAIKGLVFLLAVLFVSMCAAINPNLFTEALE